MGRAAKYTEDEMLDAAVDLLATGGPGALTAAAVARALSAPNGSVYHRFASRDHLAAALWMRTVERFDADVVAALRRTGDPLEIAVGVAVEVVHWSDDHPGDAFVLTMFRREDLAADDSVPEIAARARALGARQRDALVDLAGRLDRPPDLVAFAVAGVPLAAVRPYVCERSPIPEWVSEATGRAVRAALAGEPSTTEDTRSRPRGAPT